MSIDEAPRMVDVSDLERVASGATWGEGPVWMPRERVVRWSDIPADRILEYSPSTGITRTYRDEVEFANGRTLDLDGSVLQCSHGRRAVERDRDGVVEIVVDRWNGHRLNSPNDVVVASDGSIWFTDPPYGIEQPQEGHAGTREYGANHVFRVVAGEEPEPVVTDIEEPNGLAFSPDESVLYVTDTSAARTGTGNHHIRAYDVVGGGRAVRGRLFAVVEPGVPDGIRVDEEGRVWSSSADSVQIFDPTGVKIGAIPVPERVGNLCFGGDDGRWLYIAATTGLYRVRTATRDARWRGPDSTSITNPHQEGEAQK